MKSFNSIVLVFILTFLVFTSVMHAEGLELKPYGFIKGDMIYSSKEVL